MKEIVHGVKLWQVVEVQKTQLGLCTGGAEPPTSGSLVAVLGAAGVCVP